MPVTRATKRKKCPVCEKMFTFRASHAGRRKYCSKECQLGDTKEARAARKKADAEAAAALAITEAKKKHVRLTPDDSAEVRGQIASYMKEQIMIANLVVLGTKEWSPTQARVFGMLLNKVVPDLNASFVQQEVTRRDITQLSREDLEALAIEMRTIEATAEEVEEDLASDRDDILKRVSEDVLAREEKRDDPS